MPPLRLNDLPLDVLHNLMVSEMRDLLNAMDSNDHGEIKACKKQCEKIHDAIVHVGLKSTKDQKRNRGPSNINIGIRKVIDPDCVRLKNHSVEQFIKVERFNLKIGCDYKAELRNLVT